jgi:hypothetical protein
MLSLSDRLCILAFDAALSGDHELWAELSKSYLRLDAHSRIGPVSQRAKFSAVDPIGPACPMASRDHINAVD